MHQQISDGQTATERERERGRGGGGGGEVLSFVFSWKHRKRRHMKCHTFEDSSMLVVDEILRTSGFRRPKSN